MSGLCCRCPGKRVCRSRLARRFSFLISMNIKGCSMMFNACFSFFFLMVIWENEFNYIDCLIAADIFIEIALASVLGSTYCTNLLRQPSPPRWWPQIADWCRLGLARSILCFFIRSSAKSSWIHVTVFLWKTRIVVPCCPHLTEA